MGGPWRERGFDPAGWRAPRAQVALSSEMLPGDARMAGDAAITRLVLGYVAAVVTSLGALLLLMAAGW